MAQLLPKDESFIAPEWSYNPIAAGQQSPPWFYWYVGFNPTEGFSTTAEDAGSPTTGELFPMRPTGPMPGKGTAALLRPNPQALTSIPCIMTDTNGPTYENTLRSILCREEASFSYDDNNITVVFGMDVVGGATEGFAHSGSNGSSPQRGGRFRYPASPSTTGDLLTGMGVGTRGTWSSGGPMSAMGSDDSPLNPWPAWQGNAVYFRVGEGDSKVTNGAVNDTDEVKRLDYYSCVDHYAFYAYPAGTATDPDLYVELWRVRYVDQGGTGNFARLLIKQKAAGCVDRIDFRQPFRMRVEIKDFSGIPDIYAFIGPYTDANGDIQPEVACFKDGVLDTLNDYVVGYAVAHTDVTGRVIDINPDNIEDHENQTIGFATATDLALDVSAALGETDPVIWQVHTGLYSLETKDIPADPDDPVTVRYRDEFSRIVESGTNSGNTAIVNPILSSVTGVEGVQLNGLFTFDGFAQQYPVTIPSTGLNLDLIRRLMFWTDPPWSGGSVTYDDPNDYVTLSYTPDNTLAPSNRPYYVTRSFVHLRPSSQLYNHHRKIEFQAGAENDNVPTIDYEMGIHLRGYFDGYTTNGLGCWLHYRTNGNNVITYAEVTIGYRDHTYTEQNPENVTGSTFVVARKIWDGADPVADGFPDLFGTPWHSLDFKAIAYAGAPSPETIGLYNVEIDGVEIELDDTSAPYQSAISSPYTVVEPSPRVAAGRAEGFWFLSSVTEVDVVARNFYPAIVRNWTEEALVADPGPPVTDTDSMSSIEVSGEGTPAGELNTGTGALSISGGGVWDVETEVQLQVSLPRREVAFDSGHRYTSPMYSKPRRRWNVTVRNMDMDVYQALLDFYNSHNGIETPFTFVVPIPDDGTAVGATAESVESVYGWFGEDSMRATQITFELYDVSFGVEELLVP